MLMFRGKKHPWLWFSRSLTSATHSGSMKYCGRHECMLQPWKSGTHNAFKEKLNHAAIFFSFLFILTSSGLTSHLAAVMYSCTPQPCDITVHNSWPDYAAHPQHCKCLSVTLMPFWKSYANRTLWPWCHALHLFCFFFCLLYNWCNCA